MELPHQAIMLEEQWTGNSDEDMDSLSRQKSNKEMPIPSLLKKLRYPKY